MRFERFDRRWIATAHATLALLTLTSCISINEAELAEREGVIFLTQSTTPTVVMEALFEGRIELDAAGCVRLVSEEPATVVWPKDFTLVERNGSLLVRDPDGRDIGRLGGNFRLGGGFVNELHSGINLSSADRQRAGGTCPGSFWIVGDVP